VLKSAHMAIRETLQIGDPRLKLPNKPIENFDASALKQVIEDLVDTMRKNGLIGIAAPQIGENSLVFVTEPRKTPTRPADQTDELRIFINPKITEMSSREAVAYEGCGCVANGQLFGPVKRPKKITIEAYDQEGKKFQLRCDGILGRVVQHEYDHLQGIEFTEKITDYKKLMSFSFYIAEIKNSKSQTETSLITVKDILYF